MKKITFPVVFTAAILLFWSCSTTAEIKKAPETRTLIADVIGQKGVLVGEFSDGPKVVTENINADVVTWEGWQLLLRTQDSKTYEYISHEMFYEGDRLIIVVQDGKVLSVKFAP